MRYPIGQQNFQGIREDGCVYIDKTDLVYKLVNEQKYVFLSRPRRFGKSLLLSTIQAYFEGRKELFEGLAIEKLEKEWKKYPVLHLELTRAMSLSHKSLIETLNQQFEVWENELGIISKNSELGSRFSTIIIESYKKYGQRVVVLVDEYDNPLINTLHNPELHSLNRELLKSIYTNLKALDEYIRFGMLTGVSRFTKMSVFSGLNNLNDISMDMEYSSICGFTEAEILQDMGSGIQDLAKHLGCNPEEAMQELKRNYDGYHFTKSSPDIYNPFSLILSLDKGEIGSYWFATGTPKFLVDRIYEENENLRKLFSTEASSVSLISSDALHSSLPALLFQTGYLTIKSYDKEWKTYRLGIPNREVKQGLLNEMVYYLQERKSHDGQVLVKKMVSALRIGNPEEFMSILQSFFASIPYRITQNNSELFFENNIYIISNLIGLYCEAETATSEGRIDLLLKTQKYIYVIEIKRDGSAEEALRQIENKNYTLPYLTSDKQIFKIGVNFSSTSRNITDWIIKN